MGKNKDTSIDNAKEQRKLITIEIGEKDKEIDAVQAQIEEKQAAVKAMGDTEAETRAEMQKMFEERDDIKQRIGEQMDDRNALRQVFREATNKWYDYQRAIRAQKQMKWEEKKK